MTATTAQQAPLKARVDELLARNSGRNSSATAPETGRNNRCVLTPEKLRPIKADLSLLQDAVDAVSGGGLLLIVDDLLRVLNREDFEDEQLMTPTGLEALARCVQATMMRENGQVPPGWTSITKCRRCGPVWIWPGAAETVDGCPWCHNPRNRVPKAELLATSRA